jgi:two-component system LytT family response regulator
LTGQAHTSAFIVEDEPLARARLREFVGGTPWLECIGEATNGRAAVSAIDELQPDLVFLDVQLPRLSGVDVLRRITHVPAVIFTTAHDQFAITAFELGALDYLLKPFGRERFQRALERARPVLQLQLGTSSAERAREVLADTALTRLFVREGARIVPIATSTIEHIEASDDYVRVHAAGRVYLLNVQLADLEGRLDPKSFLRVHRSHIVNLDFVRALEPYDGSRFQVTLRSGTVIVASRQRSRALREGLL